MSGLMRDGTRPNLTRETKLSGANGDREIPVFPVELTTSRIGNHTRLMPSLLKVMTTHTHTHTHTHILYGGSVVRTATTASNKPRQRGHVIATLSLATTYFYFIYLLDAIVTSFVCVCVCVCVWSSRSADWASTGYGCQSCSWSADQRE